MYDDILVPTDGSSGTADVLDHAIATASPHDATVHSVYVIDNRLYRAAAEETKDEIRRSLEEEADVALEDVRVRIDDEGLDESTTLLEGIPHREILQYADEAGVDLIVMGTHGRTGPDRIANLGSTTTRVVEDGSVPVLVVNMA
ncbi:MAG: universal stress protein [Haloarculaceae archaeon]